MLSHNNITFPISGKKWTVAETDSLVKYWGKRRELRKCNIPARDMWRHVVEDLAKDGFIRTIPQCMSKIDSVLDEHKLDVDEPKNSGEGGGRTVSPYYDRLNLILGDSVSFQPKYRVAAGSSNQCFASDASSSNNEEGTKRTPAVHRKTKAELQLEIEHRKVEARLAGAAEQQKGAEAISSLTDYLKERDSKK